MRLTLNSGKITEVSDPKFHGKILEAISQSLAPWCIPAKPQRLKPASWLGFAARLKPCPFPKPFMDDFEKQPEAYLLGGDQRMRNRMHGQGDAVLNADFAHEFCYVRFYGALFNA